MIVSRRRPHDQRLLELADRDELAVARLEAVVRDDRALLREALDVRGLLLEERHRDEQREVRVDVPRLLEHPVEDALDVLPQRVAPRLDHHAAADVAVLREVGRLDDFLVPLRVVVGARGGDRGLGLAVAHRAAC